MQIRIKRNQNGSAILITFDTRQEAFDSDYERNKFFNELYGRKQIVIKQNKRYEYRREGVMDEIPHLKVANSVFIIMQKHMEMMEQFFKEWEDKVLVRSYPVLLDRDDLRNLEEKQMEKEIEE